MSWRRMFIERPRLRFDGVYVRYAQCWVGILLLGMRNARLESYFYLIFALVRI